MHNSQEKGKKSYFKITEEETSFQSSSAVLSSDQFGSVYLSTVMLSSVQSHEFKAAQFMESKGSLPKQNNSVRSCHALCSSIISGFILDGDQRKGSGESERLSLTSVPCLRLTLHTAQRLLRVTTSSQPAFSCDRTTDLRYFILRNPKLTQRKEGR